MATRSLTTYLVCLPAVLAALCLMHGCQESGQQQGSSAKAPSDVIERDAAEKLAEIQALEAMNTFNDYGRARVTLDKWIAADPRFGCREDVIYEYVRVRCLQWKVALASDDAIDKRTLVQLDDGYALWTAATKYTDLYPTGRHAHTMRQILSLWKQAPTPLQDSIASRPFEIGAFNLERYMHGLENLGGPEFLTFMKTESWNGK